MANAPSELFSLAGKVSIVLGSSRGIGRSIAEESAALGASVVVTARKVEDAQDTVDAIEAAGGKALAVAVEMSKKEDLEALTKKTLEAFGRIDNVVANVAVNPGMGPITQRPDEDWDIVMAVNVKAVVQLAKLTLPEIAKQGGGSFTIISSNGALFGTLAAPVYSVSKTAELGLVRQLAVEWGSQNVRINAILPGLIQTELSRGLWENEELLAHFEATTPLGRMGQPADIGGLGAFLATNAGAYITGQAIVADGGSTTVSNL
ncbi:SDR family NAD(P)-dependent oxidoreductase [Aurantiacibacter rhizosphaerae]|uniref:Glucose 1-dehydrogenase n=1 Tax=Aurantiacibacter rhizosphaerae TaxID=2691582 RepID=A0A844XDS5_9SPHN|nr:glucose 1-dehydrogenase [Aurantiacibacter rhizosphaerae]MWV27764.1 glucose 1-dehydrogenase [Aurantiacibacter rhizosphaerae]